METFVLASASPRRRDLCQTMGRPFVQFPADIDETARAAERPYILVRRLAVTKAIAAGLQPAAENRLVVGADTVVAIDEAILGKPRDPAEARAMLARLSGRAHQVYTGVAVWDPVRGRGVVRVAEAAVTFRTLHAEEIERYVAGGEPMDKAGGYAIQGQAGNWVEAFRGNLETVIGLPTDLLRALLDKMARFQTHGSKE